MHGVMFMILEFFFKEKKGGTSVWQLVKEKAGCDVKDGGFIKRTYYGDEVFMDLIRAAALVLKTSVTEILSEFGHYFAWFLCHRGASASLMSIQGTTLRNWLSNLNGMHEHIQMSYPGGSSKASRFVAPEFWCEDGNSNDSTTNNNNDDESNNNSILLHYHSPRGNLLVDFVPGTIIELARWQFDLEIKMTKLDNGSANNEEEEFTTWRITAEDPNESWKLSSSCAHNAPHRNNNQQPPRKRGVRVASILSTSTNNFMPAGDDLKQLQMEADAAAENGTPPPPQCPFSAIQSKYQKELEEQEQLQQQSAPPPSSSPTLSLEQMQTIFPFHIMVDHSFTILSVGESLPSLMANHKIGRENEVHGTDITAVANAMIGQHIGEMVKITRPKVDQWEWKELKKFSDQNFSLTATSTFFQQQHQDDDREENDELEFKGSMFAVGQKAVMFALNPFVRNVQEMKAFGLYMNHLPQHGQQRDAIFLGEYITHEVERAHELDKLSRKLDKEQELSNTLLYNMLPTSVADKMRSGQTVEPMAYDHVTLFFSDIVGFTSICDQVGPWDVIDLLNQLYSVMDYLAEKFSLYKVETIGDAYMCCSGLPNPTEYHAENVCNFAVAVLECVKHVKSPVDGETPINLRIGIHTGSCTAGVVGTKAPHYSLFGDMVNVSARHEQTGSPGKIQCSDELFNRLQYYSPCDKQQFQLTHRGLVEMKGKGERSTYWLEGGTEDNQYVNPKALNALKDEVGQILAKKKWKMRKYFSRTGDLRRSSIGTTVSTSAPSDSDPDISVAELSRDDSDANLSNGEQKQQENGLCKWIDLAFDRKTGREDLVTEVYSVLLPLLKLCTLDASSDGASNGKRASTQQAHQDQSALLAKQLRGFIDDISVAFEANNPYNCFRRTVHVVVWSNYLFEQIQDGKAGMSGKIDPSPWYRLALTFAALIRNCKNSGVTDRQLQRECHPVYQIYGRNCQAKLSLNFALDKLEEEFPALHKKLRRGGGGEGGGSDFFSLFRKAALLSQDPLQEFEACMQLPIVQQESAETSPTVDLKMAERTEATMGLVMKLSDYGYFCQPFKEFEYWIEALFAEYRLANLRKRGPNPIQSWNKHCLNLFNQQVLPLVRHYEVTFPDCCRLQEAVLDNQTALAKKWLEVEKNGLFLRRGRSRSPVRPPSC